MDRKNNLKLFVNLHRTKFLRSKYLALLKNILQSASGRRLEMKIKHGRVITR